MTGTEPSTTPGAAADSRRSQDAGASPTAEQIAEICSDVVGVGIPTTSDLFVAGLHSLDLVRIVGALAKKYDVHVTAVDIFDHPTSERLAAYLSDQSDLDAP